LAQLEQLPDLLGGRRAIAARYDNAFKDHPILRPAPRATWADPSFWLYSASVGAGAPDGMRDHLIAALSAAAIDARPIWTPLHRTGLYGVAPRIGGAVAEAIFATTFSLPSSSNLASGQQDRVVDTLLEALG
jgi:dTDP-4-amino-4,6-dideoxygalactose transaminase